MKILVIEDDIQLREIVSLALVKENYIVETACDAGEAQDKIAAYDYDCILLDIMLPDGNGLDILRHLKDLRKQENVIIISARDSIEDKVAGLELGADDYLPKPFHLAELCARIRSVIRRTRNNGDVMLTLANVGLNPQTKKVTVGGVELELSRKEFDILHFFMNRHGHLINKEVLAEGVWGDHIDQCDNFDFVYAQLKNLRKKLTAAAAEIEIKAVYGFGYKLIEKED